MEKEYTKEIENMSKEIADIIHKKLTWRLDVPCPVEDRLKKPKKIFGYFREDEYKEEETLTEKKILRRIPCELKEIAINGYISIEFGDWKIDETCKSARVCEKCEGRIWVYKCIPNSVDINFLGFKEHLDRRDISGLRAFYHHSSSHFVSLISGYLKRIVELKGVDIKEILKIRKNENKNN